MNFWKSILICFFVQAVRVKHNPLLHQLILLNGQQEMVESNRLSKTPKLVFGPKSQLDHHGKPFENCLPSFDHFDEHKSSVFSKDCSTSKSNNMTVKISHHTLKLFLMIPFFATILLKRHYISLRKISSKYSEESVDASSSGRGGVALLCVGGC